MQQVGDEGECLANRPGAYARWTDGASLSSPENRVFRVRTAPGGGRTYLYAQRLQLGTLTLRVGSTDPPWWATVILLEEFPERLSVYEVSCFGPDSVAVAVRFRRDLKGSQRFAIAPTRTTTGAPGAGVGPSATTGRLLRVFDSKAGGLMVYATDTSERFILPNGHLDRYADGVVEGMRLDRGQVIGYVGTTGSAPPGTPHLHFGILRGDPELSWFRGTPVNPYRPLVPAVPSG